MIKAIFENDFFLILDKPAGVSTHNEKPSVLDYLQENNYPSHFVNRLDQETSGLLVVAKSKALHHSLSESIALGNKKYHALLRGVFAADSPEVQIWSWPLSDKAEGRRNPQGKKSDQKECRTEIKILNSNKYMTYVEATLITGRQHQIRKHAALSKHPIIGDKRYNDESYNKKFFERYSKIKQRLFLHAAELQFTMKNEEYKFYSKPTDFEKILN